MKPFRGRRSQRGHAPFAEGLFALLFWAILFFAAFTVLVPAWAAFRRRSWILGCISGLIAIFWIYLYVTEIAIPGQAEEERSDWIHSTLGECRETLKGMPPAFQGEALLDSAGVIRADWILPMLTERQLRFIEVKGAASGPTRIAREPSHSSTNEQWIWSDLQSPWLRIRLAAADDPSCATLPKPLRDDLKRPPLMSGSCLAVDAIQEPTAPLEIRLLRPSNERERIAGAWVLVDRVGDKPLAQLPTTDTVEKTSTTGRLLSRDEGRANDGCHIPAQLLFERVWGPDDQWPTAQVLARRDVRPDREPGALLAPSNPPRVLQGEVTSRPVNEWEMRQLRWPDWESALESAKEAGTVGFGDWHVNFAKREMTRLQVEREVNGHRWQVFGGTRGFFVFERYTDAAKSTRRLLAHYDASGQLQRAVLVHIDPDTRWSSGDVGDIRFDGKDVVIDATATGTATGAGSLEWQVASLRVRGFN